jgi:hypothetical protein
LFLCINAWIETGVKVILYFEQHTEHFKFFVSFTHWSMQDRCAYVKHVRRAYISISRFLFDLDIGLTYFNWSFLHWQGFTKSSTFFEASQQIKHRHVPGWTVGENGETGSSNNFFNPDFAVGLLSISNGLTAVVMETLDWMARLLIVGAPSGDNGNSGTVVCDPCVTMEMELDRAARWCWYIDPMFPSILEWSCYYE